MLGLSALNAAANGFALPSQDAFATARGEATVATADNPSAIYYNPAGITQLEGDNLRGGVGLLDYHTTFKPPATASNAGKSYDELDNFADLPRLFYAGSSTQMPFHYGLGIYAPFGGKMSWPQDTGFRSVAISGKLTYITINPVVAWKILPSLSFGAGPMMNYVSMNMNQGLLRFPGPFDNYFTFSGDGWSVGYNAGLRWQPVEQLSFGATFRSPTKVTLDGHTEIAYPGIATTQTAAYTDLTFPLTAVTGVSWRPTGKWNLEFDASYTDWRSFNSTIIHQANPPAPFHPNVGLILEWQASWMYEFGVTRYFDSGWQISAGYCFSENSVPNNYYTPLAADMNRHFFSVGTGWKGRHLSFDVAYQFGYGPEHTVTDSTPSSIPARNFTNQTANGKYNFYSNAVSISVGWHF